MPKRTVSGILTLFAVAFVSPTIGFCPIDDYGRAHRDPRP